MSITFLTSEDAKEFAKSINGITPDENGNVQIQVPGGNADPSGLTAEQISALDGMFKICAYTADATDAYKAFQTAFGIGGEVEPDEPDTEKTLISISATYFGGDVAVGTAVSALTGIVVTARYSDGSTKAVTGYTLSGTIAEGSNTITVSYGGKTTTFTVTGEAEESNLEQYEYTLANPGKLGNQDGGLNAHGSYNTTDFIEVDTNTSTLTVVYPSGEATAGCFVQFFNGDTFIIRKSINLIVRIHTFDIPNDATKFRVTSETGHDFTIYKGTVTESDL